MEDDWLVMVYIEQDENDDPDDYQTVDMYIKNPNRPPTHEEIERMCGCDALHYEVFDMKNNKRVDIRGIDKRFSNIQLDG